MSNKKDIDRLFQEKFKDFEATPDASVWEKIEQQLQKKKKKRRIIPVWWQLGGVAAALVILFTVGNTLFNTKDTIPQVVDTETSSIPDTTKNGIIQKAKKEGTTVIIASEDVSDTTEANDNSTNNTNTPVKTNQNLRATTPNTSNSSFNKISDLASTDTKASNNSKTNKPILQQTHSTIANQENKFLNPKSTSEIISQSEKTSILNTINSTENTIAKKTITEDTKTNVDTTKATENKDILDVKEHTQTIEEAIAEANNINEKEKEELHRWSIEPNVAPVYFNSLGRGSSIDEQFNGSTNTNAITMSYGIKGSYAINKRLILSTGVHRVSLNNTTTDVIAQIDNSLTSFSSNASSSSTNLQNVSLNGSISSQSLLVISKSNLSRASLPETINTLNDGNLEQRFGFIEIPLELEYRVINQKVGLNLVGGFSTLFLNENEIFADVNGESTRIGEANNLNNTSFSANFGVGVDYSVSEKLNINLEPKFKYQLNTFNNTTGNFQPFFIGVYTGLSFKF